MSACVRNDEHGFSLIELLLVCALMMIVTAGVLSLGAPLRDAFERADGGAQLEPATRSVLSAVVADVREAGSEPNIEAGALRLFAVFERVVLQPDLDTFSFSQPGGAVRVARVPAMAGQGVLATGVLGGGTFVRLDTTGPCAGGVPACGFRPAGEAVIYDTAGAQRVSISSVGSDFVVLSAPVPRTFPAGSLLSDIEVTTYGTRPQPDGSLQLVRRTTGGAEQPVLDSVVEFTAESDDNDPMRLERVTLRVRVEASAATARGPVGVLFRRAGTAPGARRWLPDVELRYTVALRNPAGAT